MNKIIAWGIIGIIAVGAASFYAGMKYAGTSASSNARAGAFANLSPEERQARFQQTGGAGGFAGSNGNRGSGEGGNFTAGEILSKDDQSITVKMQDGSTRIVLFSEGTEISKMLQGSADDIGVGEQAVITGTANQDGSLTARSIQIGGTPRNLTPAEEGM